MGRIGWSTLAIVLGGCGFEPDGAVPVARPLAYDTWWTRTEACSDRRGELDRIRFYLVPGADFDCPTGRCVGRWEPGHKIYIAEAMATNELVVRHEMLHDLLGGGGHPNPPFGIGCPLTWSTWNAGSGAVVGESIPID